MRNILKSKKGMTLVELIVAITIFTIFSVSCLAVLVPVMNVFAEVNSLSEVGSIMNTLSSSIVSDLSASTQPANLVSDERIEIVSGSNRIAYYTQSDAKGETFLWREQNGTASLVLPPKYYNGKNIVTKFSESLTDVDGVQKISYTISIEITEKNGGVLTKKDILVAPLVLNQKK